MHYCSFCVAITKSKKNKFWRPNSIGPPNNPESPSVALQKNTHRYVVQGGRGKGSNYSLNSEGLATAKEIMATVFERTESAVAKIAADASFAVRQELSSRTAN